MKTIEEYADELERLIDEIRNVAGYEIQIEGSGQAYGAKVGYEEDWDMAKIPIIVIT